MKLKPMADNVLLKANEEKEMTASGIILATTTDYNQLLHSNLPLLAISYLHMYVLSVSDLCHRKSFDINLFLGPCFKNKE